MKLVRIGWESWEVLAVCDLRGRCQVLDFLDDFERSSPAAAYAMIALLRQTLPQEGPPRSEPLCKSLGNGIYELRKQPKGKKLRVVWFYGVGQVVVCTYAFSKAEKTPQIRVEQSRLLRKQYLAARTRGDLEIIDREG
ncbi:MAG TPA: type II toxin-antitoxin system RelE/ParE family toxin [Thermoanaerobaculia bacterium]|nr:type II toxin-antitoxin system RelE/ParE family toxin [Thermoanaerobaculia bacterium]